MNTHGLKTRQCRKQQLSKVYEYSSTFTSDGKKIKGYSAERKFSDGKQNQKGFIYSGTKKNKVRKKVLSNNEINKIFGNYPNKLFI